MSGKDQILFLSHMLPIDNLKSILESGYLYTSYERKEQKIKYTGLLSGLDKINESNLDIKSFRNEFPGIYLTYHSKAYHELYNKSVPFLTLIFGVEILEQNNYHLNLADRNGFICDNLTYFKHNLDKLPDLHEVIKFYNGHILK